MGYDKEQIKRIEENVKKFNKNIGNEDKDLLTYSVEAVIDRVLLYLYGIDYEITEPIKIDVRLEKIVADVVSGIFTKYKKNESNKDVDLVVTNVSDNGQSISYSNEIRNYLATASDNELFCGCVNLISRYRRIKVVTPK